jgi:hypothetical protein
VRSLRVNVLLLIVGAMLALGLVALVWTVGAGSSEAQQGAMQNCPQPGKWAISVWSGDDAVDTGQALATCAAGVDAAYYIDPQTQAWQRWFAGRPEVTNLNTLDDVQGVVALGSMGAAPPTATPTPTSTPTPGVSVDVQLSIECFESLTTAAALETAIYLQEEAGFPTTVLEVQLTAEDDFIQENCLSVSVVLVEDPTSVTLCDDAIAAAAGIAVLIDVAESEGMPHVYLSLQLDQLNAYVQSTCL